jgi:hypothetical protein
MKFSKSQYILHFWASFHILLAHCDLYIIYMRKLKWKTSNFMMWWNLTMIFAAHYNSNLNIMIHFEFYNEWKQRLFSQNLKTVVFTWETTETRWSCRLLLSCKNVTTWNWHAWRRTIISDGRLPITWYRYHPIPGPNRK